MSSVLALATGRQALQAARQQQRQVGGAHSLVRLPARPFSVISHTRLAAAAPRQQDGGAALPPAASERAQAVAPQQPAEALEQQQQHGERWMPASWLAGWKGAGTMALSFGAVTGGGLLGSGFDISGPTSMLQALGVLALTVGIHELGHFLAAITRGIHVTKFSIGFGPTLLKWQGKEVEYSLRLLPLGGFVAFPDDDPESPFEPDDPDLLRNRSLGDRTAVISAGVAANMALALTICLLQAGTVGIAEPVYKPGVKLGDIKETTIAGRAGLRRGDIVLRVGELEVAPQPGSVGRVVDMIKDNPGRELMMVVDRQGQLLNIPVTPAPSGADGGGRIGISLAANAEILRKKADGPVQTVTLAAEEFATLTSLVCKGLYQFVTNFSNTVKNVSGPVAIIAAGAEVARTGGGGLYQFAALVNINLAVVNILPLPALDGSALLLAGAEGATGRQLDRDVEELVTAFGQAFMVLLGIWIFTHDLEWLGKALVHTGMQPPPPAPPLP